MALNRFFIPKERIYSGIFKTHDLNAVNKARKVLRLSMGDQIRIFDGEGKEYIVEVDLLRRDVFGGVIKESFEVEVSTGPYIILAQALTQSKKIDQIIKMNTEIGVSEFVFFESDHSIVKLKNLKESKLPRWDKIAEEASRQSERAFVPVINEPITFSDLFESEIETKLLLHSKDNPKSIDLKEITKTSSPEDKILVIIGPEGGFSESEIDQVNNSEIKLVHMDLPVLRTETAGLIFGSYILLNK